MSPSEAVTCLTVFSGGLSRWHLLSSGLWGTRTCDPAGDIGEDCVSAGRLRGSYARVYHGI